MIIRVLNRHNDKYALSKETRSALDAIKREAEKSGADWNVISNKVLQILEKEGFELAKLQPTIYYFESKKGKQIQAIDIQYEE